MRLLNVRNSQLEDFTGRVIPPYCILSHRWGEDEISFKEFRKGVNTKSAGYRKIVEFCDFVKTRPRLENVLRTLDDSDHIWIEWVWVDTCKGRQFTSPSYSKH